MRDSKRILPTLPPGNWGENCSLWPPHSSHCLARSGARCSRYYNSILSLLERFGNDSPTPTSGRLGGKSFAATATPFPPLSSFRGDQCSHYYNGIPSLLERFGNDSPTPTSGRLGGKNSPLRLPQASFCFFLSSINLTHLTECICKNKSLS